jgi:hypothetical protein
MAFADTLAWALAQPAGSAARALADAYSGGTTRVSIDGRSVEYRSLADIERALTALHAAGQSAASRRPSRAVAMIGDGY